MEGKKSSNDSVLWVGGEKKIITGVEPDSFDPSEEIISYRSPGVLGFLDAVLRGPEDYIRGEVEQTPNQRRTQGVGC